MERYIGLDVHAASTTFGVVSPTGKRLGSHVVETTGPALIEQLRSIAGKRRVCLEEGTQSAWLYEILSPHAEEVVVAMVSETRGQKNDEGDAYRLAEQLRTGAIERKVFKEAGTYKTLRELGRVHGMIVQDVVRVKNRIKVLFRARGIAVSCKGVYSAKEREAWLSKLPVTMRQAAATLYAQLDAVEPLRRQAEKALVEESHRHPISRLLETCPGLGPIRVARILAIVVSPMRFRTKRQFWSYCGLGILMRSSSDWVKTKNGDWMKSDVQKTRGLSRSHNRTLKCIFKGAATSVITQKDTPLKRDYQQRLAAGIKPNLAKLTLARRIAGIVLSMWKSQKEYDATKHSKHDL
jgi:transposase